MQHGDGLERNPKISKQALAEIHGDLFGWCLSRCGFEHAPAEDLVQQTYVELISGRARFQGQASLRTFVFSVAHNLARDRFRELAAQSRLALAYESRSVCEHSAIDEDSGNDAGPALWQAVGQLPARQRDVVELVFCRDMTVDEAARVIGVSPGTARVHYARAKKTLERRLRPLLGETTGPHAARLGVNDE